MTIFGFLASREKRRVRTKRNMIPAHGLVLSPLEAYVVSGSGQARVASVVNQAVVRGIYVTTMKREVSRQRTTDLAKIR